MASRSYREIPLPRKKTQGPQCPLHESHCGVNTTGDQMSLPRVTLRCKYRFRTTTNAILGQMKTLRKQKDPTYMLRETITNRRLRYEPAFLPRQTQLAAHVSSRLSLGRSWRGAKTELERAAELSLYVCFTHKKLKATVLPLFYSPCLWELRLGATDSDGFFVRSRIQPTGLTEDVPNAELSSWSSQAFYKHKALHVWTGNFF